MPDLFWYILTTAWALDRSHHVFFWRCMLINVKHRDASNGTGISGEMFTYFSKNIGAWSTFLRLFDASTLGESNPLIRQASSILVLIFESRDRAWSRFPRIWKKNLDASLSCGMTVFHAFLTIKDNCKSCDAKVSPLPLVLRWRTTELWTVFFEVYGLLVDPAEKAALAKRKQRTLTSREL